MGAAILQTREIALDKGEAEALAKAMAGVAEHYPVQASAKALAWVHLGMVAGSIYGTRAVAIYAGARRRASPPEGNTSGDGFLSPALRVVEG